MTRVFLALLSAIVAVASTAMDRNDCNPDKMTVYRVVLHTYWTREKFPKHYPDWRPPAQWSKMYGLSHDKSYVLFRLGQRVSPQVRQFAESGRPDALDMSAGANSGLFDIFVAPSIDQGAGRTDAEFFLDGNHSRVSIMARMIPSPDWFVGVDSFDLCMDGNWVDSITIEVDPIDAGTDNGFTFTAPNWPTAPQGVAYRITSKYPSHPAGSFFYPHLRRLPPIATFQFIKLREYELTEVFHRSRDDQKYDVVKIEKLSHNRVDLPDGNRALNIAEEVERNETPLKANDPDEPRIYQGPPRVYEHEHGASIDRDFVRGGPMPTHYSQQMPPAPIEREYIKNDPRNNVVQSEEHMPRHSQMTRDQASKYYKYTQDTDIKYDSMAPPMGIARPPQREPASLSTHDDLSYSYYSVINTTSYPFSTEEPRSVNKIPQAGSEPSDHSALRSLARQYREKHRRRYKSDYDPAERRKRKKTRSLDCKVSDWDSWSPCRSDGGCVGTAMRTRQIIHREKPGGKPCPPTTQSRWCAANCTGPQTVEDWRNNVT